MQSIKGRLEISVHSSMIILITNYNYTIRSILNYGPVVQNSRQFTYAYAYVLALNHQRQRQLTPLALSFVQIPLDVIVS